MDIKVSEQLWASRMLPEGIVECWFAADGEVVAAGQTLVQIRIEGAAHDVVAPAAGRLTRIAAVNDIIEPGSLLGQLDQATLT